VCTLARLSPVRAIAAHQAAPRKLYDDKSRQRDVMALVYSTRLHFFCRNVLSTHGWRVMAGSVSERSGDRSRSPTSISVECDDVVRIKE